MNPQLLQYQEQLDAVRPMLALLEHRHELLQFEGCLALTNLLSASEELRSFALQSGAWTKCKDLLFSDHEEVQRAGLEALCNLTIAEEAKREAEAEFQAVSSSSRYLRVISPHRHLRSAKSLAFRRSIRGIVHQPKGPQRAPDESETRSSNGFAKIRKLSRNQQRTRINS
ncbi:unc45b [Symbiodinium natans]|uniref:Unc45b protein n=1 Tax=Symbiodinium natans TaxID=878477 RepID=A0A812TSN2_9DINO|nr:unc45b [Symbiodinium natans]